VYFKLFCFGTYIIVSQCVRRPERSEARRVAQAHQIAPWCDSARWCDGARATRERDSSGRSRRLRVRARHEVAREVLKPRIARREPQKNTPKACFFVCEAARPKRKKINPTSSISYHNFYLHNASDIVLRGFDRR
jgi:hypothetical protein